MQNTLSALVFAHLIQILEKCTPVTEVFVASTAFLMTNRYSALFNLYLVFFCYNLVKAFATYDTLSFSTNWRFMTSLFQVGDQKYTYVYLLMR